MKAVARMILRFFDSIPETSGMANTVFRWILIVFSSVMVILPLAIWLAGDPEMAVGELGMATVYVIGYTFIVAVSYALLLFVKFGLPEEEING